jgi:FAD/FMN-containing dehydrogenase
VVQDTSQEAAVVLQPGSDGFYHPANEGEIRALVERAIREGRKIRVRGSAHSVNAAIFTRDTDHPAPDEPGINILLDRLRQVAFDDERIQVTAQAGCHLGRDPADPTQTSTVENSLFYQLDRRGWAFPVTGGVMHQTVAGFISTGSSGGSAWHSVDRNIIAIRLIDGLGQVHELRRNDDPSDPFFAAGVSMGLLGIITSVTFQCVPRYTIEGKETTAIYRSCEIDLFGEGHGGKPSLETFLRETEYTRIMWWPQPGVEKAVVWQARRLTDPPPTFKRKPYHVFPTVLGRERPSQLASSVLFRLFRTLNPPGPASSLGRRFQPVFKQLYKVALNGFLASGIKGPQRFRDTWWQGLPADDRIDYRLLPTRFHEVWIPIARTAEVMATLREHQRTYGFAATGTFPVEIKPTARSDFWMSPAYHDDVIKLDTLWFAGNPGDPVADYYPQFWELLKPFDYRLHWGKALSGDVAYLRRQYPRWDDFMRLREQMDPHQIFVTDYWRSHLGIAPARSAAGHS